MTKTITFIAHTHAKHPVVQLYRVHVHIHVQYYVSLQRQMSVLSVIFLSKVQLYVSRTAINNQFSSR